MEVEPKLYRAIMVSSTFTDLEAHRREVIDAILRFGFQPNVMEYSGARSDADVIDTSLRMVRESVAYLCVIGHKYGQTPIDVDRNPDGLSITELEFNEARRLGRPILLFLMADDHPVTKGDVEPDAKKRKKLEAFRKQAKRVDPGKPAERVYESFASKDEFAKKAAIAVGLQAIQAAGRSDLPDRAIRDAIARFIDVKPEANKAELTDAIDRFEAGYSARARTQPDIPAPPPPGPTPPPTVPLPLRPSSIPHTPTDRRVVAARADFGWVASPLLLGAAAILFALLVGYGWFLLIAPATGSAPALLLAPIIVAIGLLAARIIGRAVASTSGEHGSRRVPLVLYPLLFSVSTLAVFNTAFYVLEGPVILRETIDDAETKLLALAGATTAALRTKRGEATAAAVERMLTELDTEITNPAMCGAGPGARILIGQIQAILPNFREFRVRPGAPCDIGTLQQRSQVYREQAYHLLNLDPEERRLASLRTQITGPIANSHMRLHAVRNGLVSSGFGANYDPVLRALEDAANVYSRGRERLAAVEPAAAKPLAASIDVSRARKLGSVPSLAGLLAARLDHWSTWIYFLIAAALDIMLIFLFAENFRRVPPPEPDYGLEAEDLQFLWVDRQD